MPEITDLLERATPRRLPPPDVADLVRRGRRRRQRRRAALLATPVLAAGLVVAAPWDAPDRRDTTITESLSEQLPLSIALDGDDITVVLERIVTDAQLEALEDLLADDPGVAAFEYYDVDATLAEYRRIFADNEAMLERLDENPDLVPSSFRIVAITPDDPAVICALADHLQPRPGVLHALTPEHLTC